MYQKTCDKILKTGNSGCCRTTEWDCCETEDEVLTSVAVVILTSAYMCLIKPDFHLSNCSFSHSGIFCSSHSSQAVRDSNGNVVVAGRVTSNTVTIDLTLLGRQTEQESVKSPPATP